MRASQNTKPAQNSRQARNRRQFRFSGDSTTQAVLWSLSPDGDLSEVVANPSRKTPVKTTISAGISKARQLALLMEPDDGLSFAHGMVFNAVSAFWEATGMSSVESNVHPLRPPPVSIALPDLPLEASELARFIGSETASLDLPDATHAIGALYTGAMPRERRSRLGAYYTPPALCERLLDMASESGVDWSTARVLDPACGGGAFLALVARRMVASLGETDRATVLESVEGRLHGIDLDPFAAWLAQVLLDATLVDLGVVTNRMPLISVQVENALETDLEGQGFDLIVGNPPYGRTSLLPQQRRKYSRSLYGHANLYGLFTDQALRFTRNGGAVAYVTPTSFLAGAYFKALRRLLGQEAPPVDIDFIAKRKGVFADVLQETVLTLYKRGARTRQGHVRFTSVNADGSVETTRPSSFYLPEDPENPWLIPRSEAQTALLNRVNRLPHRLADFGYGVSTGPLVWNRHKDGLRATIEEGALPLIWAESVRSDGAFDFRSHQRAHQPYFRPKPGQEWLITRAPCVLLKRTTAKEQSRRLVAAELPTEFDAKHGGVVVENHLNVIRPFKGHPQVSTGVMAVLLNSSLVDQIFRCINGSVAVSAYELEALPLPPPHFMHRLEEMVGCGANRQILECEIERLYGEPTG